MRAVALGLTLALGLAGCAHSGGGFPKSPSWAYQGAYDDWTRELRLNQNWETHLIFRATLLSDPMRAAQATYISAARVDDPDVAAQRQAEMLDEIAGQYVVVFTAFSPWEDARIFGSAPDDPWQLRLRADGQLVEAVEIKQILRPSAEEAMLYPELNVWSDMWVARFEQAPGARDVVLQVTGPRGRGEVGWTLQ